MEDKIDDLVGTLITTTLSDDILLKITKLLQELDVKLYFEFLTEHFCTLHTLEQWAWKMLSKNSNSWSKESNDFKLFENLALFNKNLIFLPDEFEAEKKSSLLIPQTTDMIDKIFEQIEKLTDENDLYYQIISYWLNNLSYLINEYTQFIKSPIISYINNSIASKYVMTSQYKFYLKQLQEPSISQTIFTTKQYFYMKTCSFSLSCFFFCKKQTFPFTSDEILRCLGNDYLQIIHLHSLNVQLWNKELLGSITHLINFMCNCHLWRDDKEQRIKTVLSNEEIAHDHIQSLIRIIDYKPFHTQIELHQKNDETLLIDTVLSLLLILSEIDGYLSYMRTQTNLLEIILPLAERAVNSRVNLYAYGLLGELLCDQRLKELKIPNNACEYFFYTLEKAWHHPAQKFQRSTVQQLLRGFLNLAKSDSIQQRLAEKNKVSFLIEMCDRYPIVYDILWALSFNHDIQEQLRSNKIFMCTLSHLRSSMHNEQMKKIAHGILWNLEADHEDRPVIENDDEAAFDIMISYSHKEKTLCKQLYDELIRAGYRVWIDFDQMHGNVMDAMAQAIERSNTVIICMSEQYRRSNYCRAEAYYAFQRQLKIVPVLVQEHYKPDGWLLFLVGQLLYVDYIKYDFQRAMQMLFQELKTPSLGETRIPHHEIQHDTNVRTTNVIPTNAIATNMPLPLPLPGSMLSPPMISKHIAEWNKNEVQDWLNGNNLQQMARLLSDYDGASLVYLNKYLLNADAQRIIKLLEDDSLRRTNENLSLIELARFQSLVEYEQKQSFKSKHLNKRTERHKWNHIHFCHTM